MLMVWPRRSNAWDDLGAAETGRRGRDERLRQDDVLAPSCGATRGAPRGARRALLATGWQEPDRDEFEDRVVALLESLDGWVCDGNYGSIAAARADTIVWLDLPLRTCLRRVLGRAVRRTWRRESLWGTNRERWSRLIGRDSLAWWVVTTHARRRRDLTQLFGAPAYRHLRRVRLRSSAEADVWLADQGLP